MFSVGEIMKDKNARYIYFIVILVCVIGFLASTLVVADNKTSFETEITKKINSKLSVGMNTGYTFDSNDNESKLEPSVSYKIFPFTKMQLKYTKKIKNKTENKLSFKLSIDF